MIFTRLKDFFLQKFRQTYVAANPPYPYAPMIQTPTCIPVPEDASQLQAPEEYASSYTPNSAAPNIVPQHPR